MLKLLVLLALVLAVIYFFSWANRRPPGDWRRDDHGEGNGPMKPDSRLDVKQTSKGQSIEYSPKETADSDNK